MSDKYILDENNDVVETDLFTWAAFLEDIDRRRVALTDVLLEDLPSASVSTVFLGLDHQFGNGPPLLFETLVQGDHPLDGYMDRYSTWAEAEEGHKRIVEMLENGEF